MIKEPEFAQIGMQCITTPGAFIGYIADEQDAAIAFVVKERNSFNDGTFAQLMLVLQVPNGHVQETIKRLRIDGEPLISKTLTKLIEAGLVK